MFLISQKKLLFICSFIISLSAISQNNQPPISVGIETGTLVYQGDLVPGIMGSFRDVKLLYGVNVSKQFFPHFGLKASLLKGQISAD